MNVSQTPRRRPQMPTLHTPRPSPQGASSGTGASRTEGPGGAHRPDSRPAYTEPAREAEGIGREAGRTTAEPRRDFEGGIGAALPSSSTDATISERDGRIVLDAGGGNDQIDVNQRSGGGIRVSVNGTHHDFTAEQADRLTIIAGRGDDQVDVDMRVTADLRIEGGDGDDTLRGGGGDDVIAGGRGDDYIEGGDGDDSLNAGAGRDVVYGLDGDDRIGGGDGRDYLDGGRGHDRVAGGDGIDQVIGGRGDDDLRGGAGDDVLVSGHGRDAFGGDAGADRIFREGSEWTARDSADTQTEVDMAGGDPGTSVSVSGDARFDDRVQSDLDAMRSIPSGRALLEDLDRTGRSTTIRETSGGNATGYPNPSDRLMTHGNTVNGAGTDARIDYNPTRTELAGGNPWSARPPVVGLQHELVHAENAGNGNMPTGSTDGTRNRERIAVGLSIDEDGNAATPRTQPNRHTENGFRADLNLENRDRY